MVVELVALRPTRSRAERGGIVREAMLQQRAGHRSHQTKSGADINPMPTPHLIQSATGYYGSSATRKNRRLLPSTPEFV